MRKLKLKLINSSLTLLICCSSCKPESDTAARPQHEFKNTVVQNRDFSPCKESDLRNDLPQTHTFLSKLKNHIAKSNPQTFSGVLAPENLCLVVSAKDTGIGGGAFGDFGRIEIEAATILKSANDAELAAVVCHELAHVSMRHVRTVQTGPSGEKLDFTMGKGPDHYFKKISLDPNYVKEKAKLDQLQSRLKEIDADLQLIDESQTKVVRTALPSEILSELEKGQDRGKAAINFLARCSSPACMKLRELSDTRENLMKEKFELHESHIPVQEYVVYQIVARNVPPEVFLTWAEREADEVGLEICVRAGFDTEALKALPKRRLTGGQGSPPLNTLEGCRSAISKALPSIATSRDPYGRVHEIPITDSSVPGAHPENCWRLFNLERELVLHQQDFKPFRKNILTVVPGGLDRAKQELSSSR